MSEDKMPDIDIEKLTEALKDPKVQAELKAIAEDFMLKQQEELLKPKFQKLQCTCHCCQRY